MIVVADAGPVLHLHWIDCMTWGLPQGRIHIVEEVWLEIEGHAAEALRDPRFQRDRAPNPHPEWRQQFALHTGEIAAIAFAFQHSDALLLTDDEAARRACGSLGLAVVGTIGLVLEAARAGRVDKATARVALKELPMRGRLHIKQELLAKAILALDTY